ncbi:MAG TPA: hypothetical protein VKY74_12350 [Chloroflexia bacterium]|nr:hypothetical protein [Chloroflexia bacterium]
MQNTNRGGGDQLVAPPYIRRDPQGAWLAFLWNPAMFTRDAALFRGATICTRR